MPLYEYRCKECRQEFAFIMHNEEHDATEVACPGCRGKEVIHQHSVFSDRILHRS